MHGWGTSTWISVLSLLVSIISVMAAAWSAWIARRSLEHARYTYGEQVRVSFERERSALLELITKNRSEFEKTRLRLDSLKTKYESSSQPVKEMLRKDAHLIDEHTLKAEGAVRQCWSLWEEVAEWSNDTGLYDLVHHQSRYKALIEDDRFDQDTWLMVAGAFEEKLTRAGEYVSGTSHLMGTDDQI